MRAGDLCLALAIGLIWGGNFVVTKLALSGWAGFEGAPPVFFAALRFVVVTLALAPLLYPLPKGFAGIVGVGLLMGAVHFALMFVGLKHTSASAAAVAVQLMPPFVVILSVFVLGERVGWRRGIGVACAFLGVAWIAFDPDEFSLSMGVVLVGGAALAGALGSIFMKRVQPISPLRMQAWTGLISAPPLLAISFALETGQGEALITGSWGFWAAVMYVAAGAAIFGHGGYFYLVRRYEASLVAPLFLLVPVWGVLAGVVVLSDPVGWALIGGAGLAIVGVLIVVMPAKTIEALRSRARSAWTSLGERSARHHPKE